MARHMTAVILSLALCLPAPLPVVAGDKLDATIAGLEAAAEAGSNDARVRLGRLHEIGLLVPQDWTAAERWFRAAAETGDPEAQARLGHLYLTGAPGIASNPGEGIRLISLAADQGNPRALGLLAECYRLGTGVAEDDARSESLRQKAYAAGDGYTAYLLGNFTEAEARFTDDPAEKARLEAEALSYWRVSAERGDPFGEYNYAGLLMQGRPGLPADPAQALRWYLKAAQDGHAWAQYEIGRRYRDGDGVPKDAERGNRWLAIAAANGNMDAREDLNRTPSYKPDPSIALTAIVLGVIAAAIVTAANQPRGEAGTGLPDPFQPDGKDCGFAVLLDPIEQASMGCL